MTGDAVQAVACAQRIAIAHGPQRRHRLCHRCRQRPAEVAEPIELAGGRLAKAIIDRHAVVAVDGGGASSHGAGRPLCPVMLVACDALLRCDLGRDHRERIGLRCHLEQRTGKFRRCVHRPHIASDHADLQPCGRAPNRSNALPQCAQCDQFELSDAVGPVVEGRAQHLPLDFQLGTRLFVIAFREAGKPFKPVHAVLLVLMHSQEVNLPADPRRVHAVFHRNLCALMDVGFALPGIGETCVSRLERKTCWIRPITPAAPVLTFAIRRSASARCSSSRQLNPDLLSRSAMAVSRQSCEASAVCRRAAGLSREPHRHRQPDRWMA